MVFDATHSKQLSSSAQLKKEKLFLDAAISTKTVQKAMLKGPCHEIFDLPYFHQATLSATFTHGL
jgi:hypothetical protein